MGDFNAPAGEQAYQTIVGNDEYVDQYYSVHPQRFYQPSYHGQIDGWKNDSPKRIDYIFKRNCSAMQIRTMDLIFNDHFYPVVSDHFGYLTRFDLF